MSARAPATWSLAGALGLLGCAGEPELATAGSDATSEHADTDGSEDAGETGEDPPPPAPDPCPAPACLCFADPVTLSFAPELAIPRAKAFDLDGDGVVDQVDPGGGYLEPAPVVRMRRGLGPGLVAERPTLGPTPSDPLDIASFRVRDVDSDGAPDFAFLTGYPAAVYLVPAPELWLEALVEHRTPLQAGHWEHLDEFVVERLTGDAYDSAFVLDHLANLVEVLTWDPEAGRFEPRALLGTDLGPRELHLLDLDDDGDLDLVTVDRVAQGISVFRWDVDGFAAPLRLAVPDIDTAVVLPTRGELLIKADGALWAVRDTAEGLTVAPAGALGPSGDDLYYSNDLVALPGVDALLWFDGLDDSVVAVCPDPDLPGGWAPAAAPLWRGPEHGASEWRYADQDDDGLADLSLRSRVSGEPVDWRLYGR